MRFWTAVKEKSNKLNVIFFKEIRKRLPELSEFKLQPYVYKAKRAIKCGKINLSRTLSVVLLVCTQTAE